MAARSSFVVRGRFSSSKNGKAIGHRFVGQSAQIGGKGAFGLLLDQLRRRVHLAGQRARVTGGNATGQFDRGIGLKGLLQPV